MENQTAEWVHHAHWTHHLAPNELDLAIASTVEKIIPANGYLCRKGEEAMHWIGVVDGLVKICNYSFEGKAITFSGIPPGGWFGEGTLLKSEIRRYDALALQESKVAYMNRKAFQWLLDHSIGFNRFLLRQINERLGQAYASIESHSLLSPDGRVACCLAGLFNPVLYPGFGTQLRVSQEELGYLTNLSRQRVNLALRTLEQHGLLKAGYGKVEILDLEGLRSFVP